MIEDRMLNNDVIVGEREERGNFGAPLLEIPRRHGAARSALLDTARMSPNKVCPGNRLVTNKGYDSANQRTDRLVVLRDESI
jgi:hypothetical protein